MTTRACFINYHISKVYQHEEELNDITSSVFLIFQEIIALFVTLRVMDVLPNYTLVIS